MDTKKTGTLIAEARRAKKMTQSELAELLHVSNRAVSKWERGAGFPDVSLLEPLADALGLSVIDLLHGELSPADAAAELPVREALRIVASESRRALRRMAKISAALIVFLLLLWNGFEFLATNGDGFDHGINARSTRIGIENHCRDIASRGVCRIEISDFGCAAEDLRVVLTDAAEIEQFLSVLSQIKLEKSFRDWGPASLSQRVAIYTSGWTTEGRFIDTEDSCILLTFPAVSMTVGDAALESSSPAALFFRAEIHDADAWKALAACLADMGYS